MATVGDAELLHCSMRSTKLKLPEFIQPNLGWDFLQKHVAVVGPSILQLSWDVLSHVTMGFSCKSILPTFLCPSCRVQLRTTKFQLSEVFYTSTVTFSLEHTVQ